MTESEQTADIKNESVEAKVEAKLEAKLAATSAQILGSEPIDTASRVKADLGKTHEVSAATVGRMLGLASSNEVLLLEGKIDLISTKLSTMALRIEKMANTMAAAPTGSDMERLDAQIASLRTLIKDMLASLNINFKDSGSKETKVVTTGNSGANAS